MTDDPIDLGPVVDIGRIDVNAAVRDLMTVAKVALGDDMPELEPAEALALLHQLLGVVERTMPSDLQVQDQRVDHARGLLGGATGASQLALETPIHAL